WPSGSDPGFITETLPLALLTVQRRVDGIEIEEFGDLSRRPSPHMVMEQMRFGKPLAEFDPDRRKTHLFGEYQPPLTVLAAAAGFTIDEWTAAGGATAARQDTPIVSGEIKAGTAAAQKVVITGRSDGAEVIRFTQYAYVTMDTDPPWDLRPTGWRLRIHRAPPFQRPPPPARPADRPPLVRPRLQRQRPGQRHPLRVRRASRDPDHRGPPAHPAAGPAPGSGAMTVTSNDDGRLSRAVLGFEATLKRLVKAAREPGVTPAGRPRLAECVATGEFEGVGTCLEVMTWPQYTEFLTQWAAASMGFDTTVRRVSELPGLVYLELEERHTRPGSVAVVNSLSVYEFNEHRKNPPLDVSPPQPR